MSDMLSNNNGANLVRFNGTQWFLWKPLAVATLEERSLKRVTFHPIGDSDEEVRALLAVDEDEDGEQGYLDV